MGKVYIQSFTTENPIAMIGAQAGVCYGADISDQTKNFNRGLDCLKSNHGRTLEFPDVYLILDGYSARVIREFYTHIGGAPTRLQSSTRYIEYGEFDYITPKTLSNPGSREYQIYKDAMEKISSAYKELQELEIPKEDIANLLPLGMTTRIVCKCNARFLIDMSHQRECSRAYWEYREMFSDIKKALDHYSYEWRFITEEFKPKCEVCGYCTEKKSCGRKPKKSEE